MFEIIVATHGKMSDGIVDAAKLIMGDAKLHVFNLVGGQDVNELSTQFIQLVNSFDKEQGVLFLVDLPSASPYNQALLAINQLDKEQQEKCYVLSGVNLPMVITAMNAQLLNQEISEVVSMIKSEAINGIQDWSIHQLAEIDDEDDGF